MKVKVGDKIFDGNEQPIMVILEPWDKENIAKMPPEAKKYCSYPENMTKKEIRRWMKMT